MPENILNDDRTNIVSFDPSMTATGFLIYKPHRIFRYGCIRKKDLLEGREFQYVMDEYSAYQIEFANELVKLLRWLDPEHTHVIMEQPTGSQSSKAAWGMAMASSTVISSSIAVLRKNPIIYKERDAKMYMFNSASVGKQETLKTMWSYWRAQGIPNPENTWSTLTTAQRRDSMEHVADAMLILNLHLKKIYDGLDIQNP